MKRLNNHNKTGSDTGVYFDQGHQMVFPHWHQIQTLTSNNPKVAKYVHSCWTIIISERCRCIFTITQWNTCFHVYCVTCVIVYVHSCWSFRFISVSRSLASITFKWWFPRTIFAGKHFWHSIHAHSWFDTSCIGLLIITICSKTISTLRIFFLQLCSTEKVGRKPRTSWLFWS